MCDSPPAPPDPGGMTGVVMTGVVLSCLSSSRRVASPVAWPPCGCRVAGGCCVHHMVSTCPALGARTASLSAVWWAAAQHPPCPLLQCGPGRARWALAQGREVARGCEGLLGLQPCAHSLALAARGPLFLVWGLIPQRRPPCWSPSPADSQVTGVQGWWAAVPPVPGHAAPGPQPPVVPLRVLFVEVGPGKRRRVYQVSVQAP